MSTTPLPISNASSNQPQYIPMPQHLEAPGQPQGLGTTPTAPEQASGQQPQAKPSMPVPESSSPQGQPGGSAPQSAPGSGGMQPPRQPASKAQVAAASSAHATASLPQAIGQSVQTKKKEQMTRDNLLLKTYIDNHFTAIQQMQTVNLQLKPLAEQIGKHMQDLQDQPAGAQKTMSMSYLAHSMKSISTALKAAFQKIQMAQQQNQAIASDPKNAKVISKGLGYDEKSANDPLRQLAVHLITQNQQQMQKNAMPAPGPNPGAPAQPATAQASSTPQGGGWKHRLGQIGQVVGDLLIPQKMAAIPGTEEHKTTLQQRALALQEAIAKMQGEEATAEERRRQGEYYEQRGNAAANPPQKPEVRKLVTLKGSDGQPVPATEEGGKFYDSQGNEVQNPVMWEKPIASKQDAFNEWKSDPKSYEAFQKFIASLKSSNKGGSNWGTGYTAIRALQMAYEDNPAMLPAATQMVAQMMAQKGIKLTPEQLQNMAKVPLNQPLSSTTGQPIGTKMPGAPTGSTRTQAQVAARVLAELPAIRIQVNDLAENLGPAQGRMALGFLLGAVGSTGDKQLDSQLSNLRTNLHFVGSAAARFHVNSVRAIQQFDDLIAAGKSSPEAIQGALDSIEEWAKTAQSQEKGYGETGGTAGPPAGATMKVPGSDGKMHWSDGKKDLGVVQ